jgi:hypothetical protein
VARGDVSDLVCHYAGELGFGLGGEDQSSVHEEEAAGQGEGVDIVAINASE